MKASNKLYVMLLAGGAAACGGKATDQSADPIADAGAESGCDAADDVPPGTWVVFDAQGLFSFRGPADLQQVAVSGIDSYVGQYESADLVLSFDYGAYSDPLEYYDDAPEFEASSVVIDGKTAKLVTMRKMEAQSGLTYVAAIHFPEAAEDGIKLTMWAEGRTAKEQQVAVEIFESIDFP